jgi:hypothetical protein
MPCLSSDDEYRNLQADFSKILGIHFLQAASGRNYKSGCGGEGYPCPDAYRRR